MIKKTGRSAAVLEPAEFLAVARDLCDGKRGDPPTDAALRRAVSTASYAVFHRFAREAAVRFVGVGNEGSAAFAIVYRSLEHRRMRDVCEAIQRSTLSERYRKLLRRSALSQEARDIASEFPGLQEARHLADYEPSSNLTRSDAIALIDIAATAIETFDRLNSDEGADLVALLMVGARA